MAQRGQGWITRESRKKGDVWVHHFYRTRETDGKRVENCVTIGSVAKFAREADAWGEVERLAHRPEATVGGRLTVSKLVDSYRKTELPHKAHSTQSLHEHILDNYIVPRWGRAFVDEIRVLELKKWFVAIVEENQLARPTVQKIKQVFHRLYAFAAENELVPAHLNPLHACNLRGIGTKSKSKAIVVPPETAWKIAMSLPPMARALVLLAAGTGMRVSELLGLKWGDIDFQSQTIHLNRTWLYGKVGEGKSEASRKPVAMGERVSKFLAAWQRETPYASAQDWVFPSMKLKGTKPLSGSQFVKDHIRPRFVEHGLIEAEYTGRAGLHAFRHSLATVLITEEGQDPKTVQGILRHAKSSITMDIYTHSLEGARRAALERYESRLVQ